MSITECFRRVGGGVKTHNYASAFALAAVLAASCAPFAASAGSATLKCAGYTGTETLENFQALIKLDEGRYGFKYAECADQTAGTDVWFSSDAAGDAVLEREIDTWNPDGSSYIWVKIPSLAAGTEITMHWGDASKAQPAANTAVWTGYAGVWHMGKASGAETEPDATGHGLNAVPHASELINTGNDGGNINLMVAAADGVVGGSRVNTTSSRISNALEVPIYKNQLDNFNTFTVGGWFRQTESLSGRSRFLSSRAATTGTANVYNGWELTSPYSNDGSPEKPSNVDADTYANCYVARVSAGKTSNYTTIKPTSVVESVVDRWVHYIVVFDGSEVTTYVDGDPATSGSITDALPTSDDNSFKVGFWIGRFGRRTSPFIGRYDEIRMYNGAMSADRVKADYDTVKTPTMFFCLSEPKSVTLQCAGYTGTETLANFQALIKLDEGRYGFSYAGCADQAAGTDIWFSSDAAGNNVLEREIDTWNPDGSSYIWVKIPSLAAGTEITMHWGDASKAQAAANTAVWTGYAGVWHMGKASGAETEPDATGHGLEATASASTHTGCVGDTDLMIAEADGVAGGSRVNTTANTIGNALKVPSYKNQLDNYNTFTVGGWFCQTLRHPGRNRILCSRAAKASGTNATAYYGWELTSPYQEAETPSGVDQGVYADCYVARVSAGNTSKFNTFKPTKVVESVVNRWVHYCVVFDGTSVKAYVDGELATDGTITDALPTNDNGFWIGRYGNRGNPFIGRYDEIRMYNGVMSADRVKADYDTMNAPTEFFTNPDRVATAEWTGAAGNGSVADAGNWLCKNVAGNVIEDALPTADTDVTISGGAVDMQAPSGTTLQYSSLAINCTLGADCDWRGLGSVEISGTIALGGHTLTLADTKGSGTITGEGKLVIDVAEGKTVTNDSLTLSGALQLEKTGEGTFTASKTGQTYTGGTVVSGGTFTFNQRSNGTNRYTGADNSEITIGSGGVFSLCGGYNFHKYRFVLDGGALKNDTVSTGAAADKYYNTPCIASVTLVADSSFILDAHFGMINSSYAQVNLDLAGHTLTLRGGAAVYMANVKATQGRIVMAGETLDNGTGVTRITCHEQHACDLSAVELTMNGRSCVYPITNGTTPMFKFGGYVCNSVSQVSNDGYLGQMNVYGRFAPNTDYFYGVTLQSGATLDLRQRTGCFNTKGNGVVITTTRPAATANRCILGFASGAAITVNLAGREDILSIAKSDLPLVVQWTTEPDASFMLDSETARKFKIKKATIEVTDGETVTTVSGLKLTRKSGTMLIVR